VEAFVVNGHQGIERCRTRAAVSVWWPGMSQQIAQMYSNV
jgi:hypothetical protein